ncbi:MAG: Rrf2 family transcriptional regulator [Patescibacteria group bacterium]|jgi:Rrf2 family protein
MVVFSTKSDYAVIILIELAKHKGYMSLGKLAKERRLPYRYVSRIAGELKKAGFIESKEGVTGGYALAKNPKDIHALDILSVFEDGVNATRCMGHDGECPRKSTCSAKSKWLDMNQEILELVKKYTLADFLL